MVSNPNGVVSPCRGFAPTPLGLWACGALSQGSSSLATLGFAPESLWDSAEEFPKAFDALAALGGFGLMLLGWRLRRPRQPLAIAQVIGAGDYI